MQREPAVRVIAVVRLNVAVACGARQVGKVALVVAMDEFAALPHVSLTRTHLLDAIKSARIVLKVPIQVGMGVDAFLLNLKL